MAERKAKKASPQQKYEQEVQDRAGQLHNTLAAHITESKLSLHLLLMVVDLLRDECLSMCKKKYLE